MKHKVPAWLWAVPVFTFGLLSIVGPFAVALKLGTKRAWAWCIGSGVATFIGYVLIDEESGIGGLIILVNLVISTVYATQAGQSIDWGRTPAPPQMLVAPLPAHMNRNQDAIAGVSAARRKRAEALMLAHSDPQMARDLRIGRPDLPRQYDDGGLVDMNSVPVDTMVRWLGLSQAQAIHIAEVRQSLGHFLNPEDLVNLADLDMDAYERVRERVVLL